MLPPADGAVVVEGLVRSYGARRAVDGLDLTAAPGAVTAVLGPNGAGKTTTVECCEGLRRPDAGTVRVLGSDPLTAGAAHRARVGVMLQDGGLPGGSRALDLVRHVARLHAHPLHVEELAERLGLHAVARTPLRRLSGGQRQRVALACALVGRPLVAFLDEPTAGPDPQGPLAGGDLIGPVPAARPALVPTTHPLD